MLMMATMAITTVMVSARTELRELNTRVASLTAIHDQLSLIVAT